MTQINQLTIIGTGLLGASVGLAAKQSGFAKKVAGVSRNLESAEKAASVGAIDMPFDKISDSLADADLAVIAVPLSGFDYIFSLIAPLQRPNLFITDVGSTKSSVIASAKKHLTDPTLFLGSHPMAGSEKQGPESASANLFPNKPCILTPEPDTNRNLINTVTALWQALSMNILTMTPEQHDTQTAVVSHLPHAAAALLIQTANTLGGYDVASTGFRDTTRLASSNPPMRVDIMSANRPALITALSQYRDQITNLMAILESNDRQALLDLLTLSQTSRDHWLDDSFH
ncbi:prephenate dehydrogenase [Poriferisphaera corsica]|uniref:Prephenate dehydrogenase n=1 Tax=Poriferisphaera corsica TaxID=2528020 RepID=A0A517YTW3_9BACT|nr:prephenate dehydrogenase/arogenate dehydrogenase family protein [Poriferisphaera corsica]QDU33622.1 prephenate dehydrogenase [Poriferisphaera corsica]